jgi:hypothetical protein
VVEERRNQWRLFRGAEANDVPQEVFREHRLLVTRGALLLEHHQVNEHLLSPILAAHRVLDLDVESVAHQREHVAVFDIPGNGRIVESAIGIQPNVTRAFQMSPSSKAEGDITGYPGTTRIRRTLINLSCWFSFNAH